MFLVNFKSQMRLLTQNPCLAVKFIIVRHMQVLGLGTGTPRFSSIIFLPLRALCLKDSIYDGHHSQSMHSTKCAIAPMTCVKKRDVPVQRCTMCKGAQCTLRKGSKPVAHHRARVAKSPSMRRTGPLTHL